MPKARKKLLKLINHFSPLVNDIFSAIFRLPLVESDHQQTFEDNEKTAIL